MKIKILDCTLRDGGYYTNWDFNKALVNTYFESFNLLPIDYLEIGYRNLPANDYQGEYFYCPQYVMKNAREKSGKKLAVIIDEKNVKPSDIPILLAPCKGLIDLVRIALDPQKFKNGLKLAEEIKKLGFEVGFNVMYMSKWKDHPEFINDLKELNSFVDFFYMVDSYGGVYPNDIIETINIVKERTNSILGFHGHNNLELGLVNTLTAIENGVGIVDATITGMGRGAGNLKSELLLTSLNAKYGIDVNFDALAEVVSGFELLKQQYNWGTSLPYMVSGANSLPQKNVMEWISQRYYSYNSIVRALNNTTKGLSDNIKLPIFSPKHGFKNVIIIGGGPSALEHVDAIKEFINKFKDVCIIHASSKNSPAYYGLPIQQYFCLVGNEAHRLEKLIPTLDKFEGECILPPFPRKMGTYIPELLMPRSYELEKTSFTKSFGDSHTAIALEVALNLKANNIYLVGYDGYQNSMITQKETNLVNENELLFKDFSTFSGITLKSFTKSQYNNIQLVSIYTYIYE